MEQSFQALWANTPSGDSRDFAQMQCELRETNTKELTAGNVLIKVEYSGINYKDALAVSGKGKILRQLPLIPGIDLAGTVAKSRSQNFKEGDPVLINGCNLGEKLCGGFSEYAQVPDDIVIPRTHGLSAKEAMIIGTAGFTAALAIHQMELNGLRPEKGEVLVTGASGGVGSLALCFLNQLGYEAEAWTRRESQRQWLERCGAARVTNIKDKDFTSRPLESVQWSGAIDNVGGEVLSYILPRIDLAGSIACIGLAKSEQLNTTVFPLILRGANLLGISSNNCHFPLRKKLWEKISTTMKPMNLDHVLSKTVSLNEVVAASHTLIKGQHHGRILVKMN